MDLQARKYNFIAELIKIDKEAIMDALEQVLKREKASQEISTENKKELDKRLASYNASPLDLLNWEDVEDNW